MTISEYKGYKRVNFEVGGRDSFIVCPENAAPGRPWAWRAEFFGAFDSVDMALLKKGWHLAYHCASDMYGCPKSIEFFKEFRDIVTAAFDFAPKTVIFGFSRGGTYAFNYALAHPDDVFALYLDAPVLDLRSWPGGFRKGDGAPSCWEECKRCYGLDDEAAKTFAPNPLNFTAELAAKKIPVIIVAGDADTAVPADENCVPFEAAFTAAGGDFKLIMKPGCGHHPHSLEDPSPVVDFIEKRFSAAFPR